MLTTLAVEGYRSLRSLVVPIKQLTVVTGANGTGKSSLYRALLLLAEAARNGAVAAVAREGGLSSTLWAGPERISRGMREGSQPVQGTRRRDRVALRLGFASDTFGYAIDLGLPIPGNTMFNLDPEIKVEAVWHGPSLRPSALLAERRGPLVRVRGGDGEWSNLRTNLATFDSMVSESGDPAAAPELMALREQMRSWRFYDQFRSDTGSPARAGRIGTRTVTLGNDGADLAAALQTIRENGDEAGLGRAVDIAFPGSRLGVVANSDRLELALAQPGLLRPLTGAELSDGTLRYLLWVAALLSPRPPALIVLNEPETSLHPDLLPALADLIVTAARRTQVIAVTHSAPLIDALTAVPDAVDWQALELVKDTGETVVRDSSPPRWSWPHR